MSEDRPLIPNYIGVFEEKLKKAKSRIKSLAKAEKDEHTEAVLRREVEQYKSLLKLIKRARKERGHTNDNGLSTLLAEAVTKHGADKVKKHLKELL